LTYRTVFDTDELLRLERQFAEAEEVGVETQVGQLENFLEAEGELLGLNHQRCNSNKE